jgi:hypothetical protein
VTSIRWEWVVLRPGVERFAELAGGDRDRGLDRAIADLASGDNVKRQ